VNLPQGGGTPGGSGGGPDAPKDETSPSSSTPPPSSSGDEQKAAAEEAKKQAAAAAENAKKQASEALGKLGDGPAGGELGGSGTGGGLGGAGGSTDAAAEAKAAAEKATEEAKKQASEALGKLGDAPGGMGDTDAKDTDAKESAEKAADEAKRKAAEQLDKLGDELPGADGDKVTGDKPGADGDKAEDGERETLKVKQGDKTFEMTEPDKDGEMEIKVGDGSGPAKDFKLDWTGDGEESKLGSAPGSDDGKPDKDGVHRPGPDGKIHIQDGDVKITAERPDGPSGPTIVTVDDGTGKPTTYTLGEENPRTDKAAHPLTPVTGTVQPEPRPGLAPHGVAPSVGHDGDSVGAGAGGGAGGGGGGVGGGGGGIGVATPFETATPAAGQPLTEGVHTGGGTQQPHHVASPAAPAATGGPAGQSFGGGAMPPMGGMGGGGAGGGGGDQERTNRAYRIEGEVFDQLNEPTGRITGSLLDDEDQPAARKR
jgi:hypothetical protein